MPMVEYFDPGTQSNKKIEFAYTALGRQQARDFIKKKSGEAARGGYMMPRETKSIKPGTKSPARSGHTPGVKGTGQTKPGDHHPPKMKKKPEKEVKYVDDDPFEFDKKSTVRYGGENY
jgi:hypothetical protein|tara:strand:- start:413 stop:766 length:354 start_codon:yes stop_codon:yes gene_type:complete